MEVMKCRLLHDKKDKKRMLLRANDSNGSNVA